METLFKTIDQLVPKYIDFWQTICRVETPSHDKAAVDALADFLQAHAEGLGLPVCREAFERAGDCLRIDLPGDESCQPMLMMAHMDTVHEKGAFGSDPVRLEDGILYGPGVNDCKNGITMSMLLLEAFSAWDRPHPPIRVLYTSDEEISARLSGKQGIDFFETNARGCKACLNVESGRAGAIVVGRKGIGNLSLTIHGKATHAGIFYFDGVSAIREAAHKILAIEALSTPDGETYNCGVIHGGDKPNIVADTCRVDVDIRAMEETAMTRAIENVKAIAARSFVPGTTCDVAIGSIRPPMEPTEGNYGLLARYNEFAAQLGQPYMEPVVSGGGSDAAYTTRMGIPTICAAGPCGWDVHTLHERADTATLAPRAKLAAKAILEL